MFKKTCFSVTFYIGDRPLIVQFAAHDAQTLVDATCAVAPFSDGVDLNCGCPQRCMSISLHCILRLHLHSRSATD